MARDKGTLTNIDNSDLGNYPNGRVKNNTGGGDGTPVNELVYGDLHEMKDKIMRLYGISHNGLPDNETNGHQLVEALVALASKNDFVLPITTSGSLLSIPVKLGKLKNDESIILKATVTKGVQTNIKGSLDNINKSIVYIGDFKAGEYVRMINTNANVILIRMIDASNLDAALRELNYLKKATQAQEDAGAIDTASTTPLTNKLTFAKRVTGTQSNAYLATLAANGLMSAADKQAIANIQSPTDLIKITSASSIQVSSWKKGGSLENNFNFNYIDVYPPTGKTMANFQGFICSMSENWEHGDANDDKFVKWRQESNRIRMIAVNSSGERAPKANWLAIWI